MANKTKQTRMYGPTTLTATANGAAIGGFGAFKRMKATLKVGTVTGTTPSLTGKVQGSVDGGTTWQDLITFTALTATGAADTKDYATVDAASAQVIPDLLRFSVSALTGTTPNFANVQCDLYAEV